jgi:hypothetical protein
MKNIFKIPLSLFSIVLLFVSCQKEIEFDDEIKQSKIVINSEVAVDSTWSVSVTKSLSVLDNANLSSIKNATVSITGSDGSNILLTYDAQSDAYLSSEIVKADILYSIFAQAPNYTEVSASTPTKSAINIISVDTSSRRIGEEFFRSFRIKFDDPSDNEDFYKVEIIKLQLTINYDMNGNPIDTVIYPTPLFLTSTDLSADQSDEYSSAITFTDQLFNGQQKTFVCDASDYNSSFGPFPSVDTYFVLLSRLSSDFYLYQKTIMAYNNVVGNPFAEPVRVHTNVNGGFGIFGSKSTSYFLVQ